MRYLLVASLAILFASGCAVQRQQTIHYSEATLSNNAKIGIAMSEIPAINAS